MGGLFGGGGAEPTSTVDPVAAGIHIQSSAYGLVIPLIYGRTRVQGNLLWYGDFAAIAHTTTTSSGGGGGKGGGGEVTSTNTSWTYTASFALGLCEGAVTAVGQVWADKDKLDAGLFTLFAGSYPQSNWPYMDSLHPSESIGYQGCAYLAAANYNLGSNASLPNHNFEITGIAANAAFGYAGANPGDIILDLLTNSHYGAGFPSGKVSSLTNYINYVGSQGMHLSPCYASQQSAAQMITDLMQLTNSGAYFSEGVLKVAPYGDADSMGWGYTYTAPTSTLINLGDDDFIVDGPGEDPVKIMRNAIPTTGSTTSDAYNQVQLEYLNSANEYNVEICTAQDQAAIDTFGLIPMSPITAHQVNDGAVANSAASLILQRAVYIRNQYEFRLGWNYAYLEPTDLITITDTAIGLNLKPVRILIVEEDDNGTLTITAEDAPPGVASRVRATPPTGAGYSVDYNASPGNVFDPIFIEPPLQLANATTGLEVWVGLTGLAGHASWGGANVWASMDGSTYKMIGSAIAPARIGHLTANITSGSTGPLSLQLDGLGGQIVSGSAEDAAALNTLLCVLGVNHEYMAYQTATLTGANAYNLTGLVRGAYGYTASAHSTSETVIRVDSAMVKGEALQPGMIGKTIFFKFCSFNVWGGKPEFLADVPEYQYTITGEALKAALANVQDLRSFFLAGLAVISWGKVTDPARVIDYEIRKGALWISAQVLGRTNNIEFNADGDGTYWVSAHSEYAYSATPTSVVVTGASLLKNVVATFDERATSWGGTVSGGAILQGASIVLTGGALAGEYVIPSGHEIDIGTVQACNCSVSYAARADNPSALFSAIPVVSAMPSIAGNYAGLASVRIQIATSDLAGTYGPWRDFIPGSYAGRKFKFKAILESTVSSIIAALDEMTFTVDMEDRYDKGTGVAVAAGGTATTYATPFQVAPNVQVTIINATAGDDIILTPQTESGFTVQVKNGGVGVARTINWLAQGY